MAHTYANVLVHVIFSTKERAPLLDAEIKPRVLAYLGGTAREVGGVLLTGNGPADHVHLLLSVPPTRAVSDLVRDLKANSSRWIHEQWPARAAFAWQTGFAAFSVSQSMHDSVRQYIAGQESHHQTMTFQEELVAFLKRHGVQYDERYIWQ